MKQGAREAPRFDTLEARLARLEKCPPLSLDIVELQEVLEALEKQGASPLSLQKGLAKLEYAQRSQVSARAKRLTDEIKGYIEEPPLELDADALLAALALAAETPGVSDALLESGEAKLNEASEAQAKQRRERSVAAAAEIERHINAPALLLDADKIRSAMAGGEGLDVDEALMQRAHEKIRAAARRNAAESRLDYLGSAFAAEADSSQLILAIKEAIDAGVPMAKVETAQRVLRQAELAKAPVNAAAALLVALVAPAPADVEVEAAEGALVAATDAGVDAAALEHARERIASARSEQSKRDAVAAKLVLAAVPSSLDIGKITSLLADAKVAGVHSRITDAVETKISADGGAAPVHVVKEAAARRAKSNRAAADAKAAETASAHAAAKAKTAADKAKAEVALRAAETAMALAVEADAKLFASVGIAAAAAADSAAARSAAVDAADVELALVSGVSGDAHALTAEEEEDEKDFLHSVRMSKALSRGSSTLGAPAAKATPVEACEALRAKARDAETAAIAAWASLEASVHAEEMAEHAAAIAAQVAEWAKQEDVSFDGAIQIQEEVMAAPPRPDPTATAHTRPHPTPPDPTRPHPLCRRRRSQRPRTWPRSSRARRPPRSK